MHLSLKFKEFLELMEPQANVPLTMSVMSKPFGLESEAPKARDLLVGHLLDYMTGMTDKNQMIDCLDVATAAYELGYEEAAEFLDVAPFLMTRLAAEITGMI